MRYVKFKMETGEETGEIGVLPNIHRNWPNYFPSQPQGLGHDLLEHGTKETGAFDEECAALGGFLFVRDFGSYIENRFRSFEEIFAGDLVSSIRDCSRDGDVRIPSKSKLDDFDNERIDRLMAECREFAIDGWESEYNYDGNENDNPFSDDETWSRITGWVKSGYARANRRFKGEQGMAYDLYRSVIREFEKHWTSLLQTADTGMEFSIALDYENGQASMNYSPWL